MIAGVQWIKALIRVSRTMNPDLECDAIIFVTTVDELDQLRWATEFLCFGSA